MRERAKACSLKKERGRKNTHSLSKAKIEAWNVASGDSYNFWQALYLIFVILIP